MNILRPFRHLKSTSKDPHIADSDLDRSTTATKRSAQGIQDNATTDADASGDHGLIISFPKSGKTWLSYLYVYYCLYTLLGNEADDFIDSALEFSYKPELGDRFNALMEEHANSYSLPRLRFVHVLPKKGQIPYYKFRIGLEKLNARSAVFIARDPRDILVSYYHHVRSKRNIPLADDVDLSEFLRSETLGIRPLLAYMNQVAERAPKRLPNFSVHFYEDFVKSPNASLSCFLGELGIPTIDPFFVSRAVERASFSTLQERDRSRRQQLGQSFDDDSLRFRSGKIGSFRQELTEDDQAFLDRVIDRHLHPAFERYKS